MINPLKTQHEALMRKLSVLDNLAGADQETKVIRKSVVEKILRLLDEIDRLLKEGQEEQGLEESIKLQFGRIKEIIAAEIERRTSDNKEKAKDIRKEIEREIAKAKEAIRANKNLRFILDEANKCKHELGLLKGMLKENSSKEPELLEIIEAGVKQVEEIINEQKREVLTGVSLQNKEEVVATLNKMENEVVALEKARSGVEEAKKKVEKIERKIKEYKEAKKKAKRKIITTNAKEKQGKEELSYLIRERNYHPMRCFLGENGIVYFKEDEQTNDPKIKEVEEKINKAIDKNRRTNGHLYGLRYFIGKYEVKLMVANRKLAEAQQEEQRLVKEQKLRVQSSQTESSKTERQQTSYTVAIRKEREALRERVEDHLESCQKDEEFTKQREGLLSTLEKLKEDPTNKTLQTLKGDQLAILQANPVYQGLVELGIEAASLRFEVEEKGSNGLFEAVEMNRNITSALGKSEQYQKEANAIKEEVILPLRVMLGCPNTPRGSRRATESIKGFGESLLDTCKGLLVDLPLLLAKVGIEGTASLMRWEDRLGIQDGCAKIGEACKVLFDDTMQSWEEPEEYEMRMLAVKALAKREQLYRRAFDAENYHLGQDKMLGYVTAELLQFLFGGKIVKGAAKGVGKGAEFIKGAQRGVKL